MIRYMGKSSRPISSQPNAQAPALLPVAARHDHGIAISRENCHLLVVAERAIEVGFPGIDFGAQVLRQFGNDIVPFGAGQIASDRFDIAWK
jgi:hypothetical protein